MLDSEQNNNNQTAPDAQGPATAGFAGVPGNTPERRADEGSSQVRLSGRDATLLSQMRNQYRKVFGIYFDPLEFTANDLYARATLRQCLGSGNGDLAAMAASFLDQDGAPRLHRRLGRADLEFDPTA